MSEVLIKMEMPKNCMGCAVEVHDEYELTHECPLIYKGYTNEVRTYARLEKCPIVCEAPPHGRLIDADKLYENVQNAIREYWNETGGGGGYYLAEDALKEICAAPTVIPASKEDR